MLAECVLELDSESGSDSDLCSYVLLLRDWADCRVVKSKMICSVMYSPGPLLAGSQIRRMARKWFLPDSSAKASYLDREAMTGMDL